MPNRDIFIIGTSAGGVEALTVLARGLPAGFPGSIFVVMHIPAQSHSLLPAILSRYGHLPAVHPVDGDQIKPGHIYIAPPDHHMLLESGFIRLNRGPRENRHRPSIDPMFRSAAVAYGPRVVGLVLTGSLDDGTAGLLAVKRSGGIAVVQDPQDALYPSMPQNALQNVEVDHRLPMNEIPGLLVRLAGTPIPEGAVPVPEDVNTELQMVEMEAQSPEDLQRLGVASIYTCPECHGTLWEMHNDHLLRFRCRVGHAYTAESLLVDHDESLEAALWAALRALEESASLSRRLAERTANDKQKLSSTRFLARAVEAERNAAILHNILVKDVGYGPPASEVLDQAAVESEALGQ